MMLSVAFRAPILALVLVSLMLIQNDGVVKAQFDTGAEVRTALNTTTSASPKAQVVFYHDDVTTATTPGSYDVDYYYADCLTAIPVGTPAVGITGVTSGTTAAPDTAAGTLDTPSFVNKCGTADTSACALKTTYEYVLQQLDAITDNAIKTTVTAVSGEVTTIKWCIRHRMLSSTGVENGYKAAIVTVTWVGNNTFAGIVTAAENGADNPDLNAGTVAVSAAACTNVATSVPVNYQQGENIQICLSATHNPPAGITAALVTIVKVNTLRFWIDFTPGGTNGVYDNGETTQVGMANGLPTGTTTILPANAGTGNTYCTQSFTGFVFSATPPTRGCVLSTLLAPAFFGSVAGTFVQYAGTVTVEFGSGSRRVLSVRGDHHHHRSVQQLKVGDQFDKTFVASVTTTAAADDSTCACSGFFLFKIICWIFKCLLGFD